MAEEAHVSLTYDGQSASNGLIDFYDARVGLEGFQRSLAIVTHFAINKEIIVQAPALKGARIYAFPPEQGSWKMAAVIASGIFTAGTAGPDTPLGHLISSIYDAAIHATLGVEVDYKKSLRKLIEERDASIRREQIESLAEKCQSAFVNMHRPIATGQAHNALVSQNVRSRFVPLGPPLNSSTLERATEERVSISEEILEGAIASFNMNTRKGRIYLYEEGRPISFELAEGANNRNSKRLIMKSFSNNVDGENLESCLIRVKANTVVGRSGILKRIIINGVQEH